MIFVIDLVLKIKKEKKRYGAESSSGKDTLLTPQKKTQIKRFLRLWTITVTFMKSILQSSCKRYEE
uniref:Uncharacterized protein n=1 Tax=Brassica campestris TaxID=3711 RepID=A0A3P5ZPT8_BRACM|nr:unnamed protein product [Brassica rapa]